MGKNNDSLIGFIPIAIILALLGWGLNGFATQQQIESKNQEIRLLQTQIDAFEKGVIYGKE